MKKVKVRGFSKQYLEFNGFMRFSELNILIEEEITNNVLLKVGYQKNDEARKDLVKLTNATFLETGNSLKENFKNT